MRVLAIKMPSGLEIRKGGKWTPRLQVEMSFGGI